MKTIVLTVSMILGTLAYANAEAPRNEVIASNTEAAVAAAQQDGYKAIKLEELNPKVQEAIKAYQNAYTVKSLAFDATKKLTKVTLTSKADNSEKVVILNEEGKETKK